MCGAATLERDGMTIRFTVSVEEALKSSIAFLNARAKLSKADRFFKKYGFPILSLVFFIIVILQPYNLSSSSFAFNGRSYPAISLILDLVFVTGFKIFVSLLFGLVFFASMTLPALIAGPFVTKWVATRNLKRIPPENYGEKSITINPNGLIVQGPLYRVEYNWKLVGSLWLTKEYLFFFHGTVLVTSIPVVALGSHADAFIPEAQNWTSVKNL